MSIDGIAGLAFWLAFFAILLACWRSVLRDGRRELDAYRDAVDVEHDDLNRWS